MPAASHAGPFRLPAFLPRRKLADTPFPFPWSQFTLVLLIFHTFTAPLLFVAYVPSKWLAVLLSVVTVVTYWAMNEVRCRCCCCCRCWPPCRPNCLARTRARARCSMPRSRHAEW